MGMSGVSDPLRFALPELIVFVSSLLNIGNTVTLPKDENTAAVVRFTNSLVPPLFQVFAVNRSNLVMAPFGLATSIAITMDCVQGEAFDEIIKLFKLQSKASRLQLRTGFRTILHDFRQNAINDEVAGSFGKAFLSTSKLFPPSFVDQLSQNYFVDVTTNASIKGNSTSSVRIMELRTDTGIMSHWKDFDKLAVYTYLSYSPSSSFHTGVNKTVNVPMIPFIGYFKAGYLPKLDCHGAELLFENRKAGLLLLMPASIDGLANLQKKLFSENFFDVLDSLPTQETKIMLPQLSAVTNNLELIPFLKMLGMVSAFTAKNEPPRKANTTVTKKIHDDNTTLTPDIIIRSIKQNAFFSTSYTSLNSIGTIGTKFEEAVTSNKSRIRRRREALVKITFDKPFAFFIIHREFGLILIAGQISDPKVFPNQ